MKTFHSLLSTAFALLVLFSSSSFMVGIHVCGGHVQHVALLAKAEGCGMEKKMPPCHKPESKPCCEDETLVHDAQDFRNEVSQISIAATPFITNFRPATFIAEIIPSIAILADHFTDYDPPLRPTDVTVVFQVFLI